MSHPTDPADSTDKAAAGDRPADGIHPKEPNVAVGVSLLVVAAALIVVVLAQPSLPSGLKTTIAILALVVVVALMGYAFKLWKSTRRGGRGK